MRGKRVIQTAIREEAALYGASVEFTSGSHPVFIVTFPNGSRIRDTYSGSPANIDDEAQFCRQRVRRIAKRAGVEKLPTNV